MLPNQPSTESDEPMELPPSTECECISNFKRIF